MKTMAAAKKENLRNKRGQYVLECEHCGCPDGCACSPEEPCACGTEKQKK